MSFLATIPIWLGCFACYLASDKQQAIEISINKRIGNTLLLLGYVLGSIIFSLSFSITSSLLAALVVLMLALVSHTILSTYIKRIWLFNGVTVALLLTLAGVNYVA